jgi:hypothetical protein
MKNMIGMIFENFKLFDLPDSIANYTNHISQKSIIIKNRNHNFKNQSYQSYQSNINPH